MYVERDVSPKSSQQWRVNAKPHRAAYRILPQTVQWSVVNGIAGVLNNTRPRGPPPHRALTIEW